MRSKEQLTDPNIPLRKVCCWLYYVSNLVLAIRLKLLQALLQSPAIHLYRLLLRLLSTEDTEIPFKWRGLEVIEVDNFEGGCIRNWRSKIAAAA